MFILLHLFVGCFFFKVVGGSEILEVLHGLPSVKEFLFSLYNCHYGDFFKALGKLVQIVMGKKLR